MNEHEFKKIMENQLKQSKEDAKKIEDEERKKLRKKLNKIYSYEDKPEKRFRPTINDMRSTANYYRIVAKKPRKALKWYRKLAEKKDVEAMMILGRCYANGGLYFEEDGSYLYAKKDKIKALGWYRKAAAAGDETAKQILKKNR